MDESTNTSRYSPIRQGSELHLTHQNSRSVFAETLTSHNMNKSSPVQTPTYQMKNSFLVQIPTQNMNNSFTAQTPSHLTNNSFPAQTLTHQMNNSAPSQSPTHQLNNSFSTETLTHQMNKSVSAHALAHQLNNSFPAQKLSSWKQLKELRDTRKSPTQDSLYLTPDNQRQSIPPGHGSIAAWDSGSIHGEDSISSLCKQANDGDLYDSLDNSQTKEHDTFLGEYVTSVYRGDMPKSRYNMPSNSPAHSDNNISSITVRNSKFLEECQMKVTQWQSEMINKSFCLNENNNKPSRNLRMNKSGCQSHNSLHSKIVGSQSQSDSNLNQTGFPPNSASLSHKSSRISLNGLQVNTNSQPENNPCNFLVQTECDLPKSYTFSGPVSGNIEMSSLSSELLHFRQQRRSCTNHGEENKKITSASKLNASQNMINNMLDVNTQNKSLSNAEKNNKKSYPFICHGIKKNKYNNVRYKYVHDLETRSDKFYFNSHTKTCSTNRSQCWEDTLSNISSQTTDAQETSMTPDSLIKGTDFPRTKNEHFVGVTPTPVWPNRPMIDSVCNVTLLRDKELINSNLNANECVDAPDTKESSPLNHKSNRLLFLDYLLKAEVKKSSKPKRLNIRKPRQIYKESIFNQRNWKNKDGFLNGILSVMQMKPSTKANISEKRVKNISDVKRIVTNTRTLPFDDSKSTPSIFVKSESITTTYSKSDNSHSSSPASISLDSLRSYTSKESSEDFSNNSLSLDQKLALNNNKKKANEPSRETKTYNVGKVSNQYIKGCLFFNKVLADNFNLLKLSTCNGKPQSSETEASTESDYIRDDKDIILREEKSSQSTTNESSNSESREEPVESLSLHSTENVTRKDYIIEITGNTIISHSNDMYMTSILKSVNKNPPIKQLDGTEKQTEIEKTTKKIIDCAFPLSLRGGKIPVNSVVTFGKVQNGNLEKSLDPITVLGPCYDSETENNKFRSTVETKDQTLAIKHKGPFVCNPSTTALQLQPDKYFDQRPRSYQFLNISKSRIGPCFKRFTNRPQRMMPTRALPMTTVTVQRNERRNTISWNDQVKICESPKHKSNIAAIPAKNPRRHGKRKTWMGSSKNRKYTPITRRSHSKGINVAPAGFVWVRPHCPSTGHFLDNNNEVTTAPKCGSLTVRQYRVGAKCKSLYSRNPRIVIARPLENSKKKACKKIESNRYSRSQSPGNVKSTTDTAKSHAPRAVSASGQSEPLKNARGRSKSSTPRRDPLKSSDGMKEKSKSAFKQRDKSKSSKRECDNYQQQHVASETKLSDANRQASNSLGQKKPSTNTCKAILFSEARRQDVTPVSVVKTHNSIPDISSLKENPDGRNVFSRLWVCNSKCIGDVSSMCCQLLSDIKKNSASHGFCENDIKCLWVLNKQFKCKDNKDRTRCSPKDRKHSEIGIIGNSKGVISCIRAIISKQNVCLRAIDDVIKILGTEESAANRPTSAKNMPLEVSKRMIISKEKLNDCAPRQGNSHRSKNRSMRDGTKSVCFNDDVPRCRVESAHRQQSNLRTEQLTGNGSKFKSTQQDKVIVSPELASNTEQCNSRCSRFYRSPFTLCGAGCNN